MRAICCDALGFIHAKAVQKYPWHGILNMNFNISSQFTWFILNISFLVFFSLCVETVCVCLTSASSFFVWVFFPRSGNLFFSEKGFFMFHISVSSRSAFFSLSKGDTKKNALIKITITAFHLWRMIDIRFSVFKNSNVASGGMCGTIDNIPALWYVD